MRITPLPIVRASKIRGFTLIELLVTMIVIVVLAGIAVPSLSSMLTRSRLRSATEHLRAELNLARHEALKREAIVVVSFTRNGDGSWCYGLSLGGGCNCAAQVGDGLCFVDRDDDDRPVKRVVSSLQYPGVELMAPLPRPMRFNPVRLSLRADSASFAAGSHVARVVTADLGRIRICSPRGERHLSAYDLC